MSDSTELEGDEAWRKTARQELRRARRYLVSLTRDLSEEELDWVGDRENVGSCKWHGARIVRRERELLASLVPSLRESRQGMELVQLFEGSALTWPSWAMVEELLATTRKLTEALLQTLPDQPGFSQVFLQIVNAEYAEARYIRSLRGDLGKPDVAEPKGRLLQLDTDVEHPPRFYVKRWSKATKSKPSDGLADVRSLQEHRRARAQSDMEEGHELVANGEHEAALRAFESSMSWNASADALTYQGWMHSLMGDNDAAERLCREAIALDPDFGNPYNDIGTFCLRRHEIQAAVHWFEKAKSASRYEPRHFPYVNLGRLYMSLRMPDRALEEFRGALALDPGNSELKQALEQARQELNELR